MFFLGRSVFRQKKPRRNAVFWKGLFKNTVLFRFEMDGAAGFAAFFAGVEAPSVEAAEGTQGVFDHG